MFLNIVFAGVVLFSFFTRRLQTHARGMNQELCYLIGRFSMNQGTATCVQNVVDVSAGLMLEGSEVRVNQTKVNITFQISHDMFVNYVLYRHYSIMTLIMLRNTIVLI